MKLFGYDRFNDFSGLALCGIRKRFHFNIHDSYHEPCQRLFNAIEPGSYIRPHRHSADPRDETLVAICGLFVLIVFDDHGEVIRSICLGSEVYKSRAVAAAEIDPNTWHTVAALRPGSILLEIKAGPFNPERPKDLADWAPSENTGAGARYLSNLLSRVNVRESF